MNGEGSGLPDDVLSELNDSARGEPSSVYQHLGQHNIFPRHVIERVVCVEEDTYIEDFAMDIFQPADFFREIEKREVEFREVPEYDKDAYDPDGPLLSKYYHGGICKHCEDRLLKLLCLDRVTDAPRKCWAIPAIKRTIRVECAWRQDDPENPVEHEQTEEHHYPALLVFRFPDTADVYWAIRKEAVPDNMKGHINWLFREKCPADYSPFPKLVPAADDIEPNALSPTGRDWESFFLGQKIRIQNPIKTEMESLTHQYNPAVVMAAEGGEEWAIRRLSREVREALEWENRISEEIRSGLGSKYFTEYGQQWVIHQLKRSLPQEKGGCFRIEGSRLSDSNGSVTIPSLLFFVFRSCNGAVAVQQDKVPPDLYEAVDGRFASERKIAPFGTVTTADTKPTELLTKQHSEKVKLVFTGEFKGGRNLVLIGKTEVLLSDAPFCLLLALARARKKTEEDLSFDEMYEMKVCTKDRAPQAISKLRGELKNSLEELNLSPTIFIAQSRGSVSLGMEGQCIRIEKKKLGTHRNEVVRDLLS